MSVRENLIEKAKQWMAEGYTLSKPTTNIVEAVAEMMADFLLNNAVHIDDAIAYATELSSTVNPIAPITSLEIQVIFKDFEEDTLMRGRKAVPPKNYEHAANYIIKKIIENMKGKTP